MPLCSSHKWCAVLHPCASAACVPAHATSLWHHPWTRQDTQCALASLPHKACNHITHCCITHFTVSTWQAATGMRRDTSTSADMWRAVGCRACGRPPICWNSALRSACAHTHVVLSRRHCGAAFEGLLAACVTPLPWPGPVLRRQGVPGAAGGQQRSGCPAGSSGATARAPTQASS